MSASLTVQTPELRSFQDELAQFGVVGRGAVLRAAGTGLKQTLVDHLSQLDKDDVHHHSSSSLGAQQVHFYGSAVGSVQNPQIEGDDEVSVSINSVGLAQRYYGGVIGAKNKKWLTIPAVADAYGKRAGSFNNLRFVLFRPDLAALVETMAKSTKTAANGVVKRTGETAVKGRVVYWLKKEVTQEGDPTVLPTDDEMSARAIEAGQEAVAQLKIFGDSAAS